MKTHSGEKLNKCNQCDYASSRADVLRTLLKAHNGEKSNKCNQCDFAPSLRTRLKTHSGGCRRFEEAENTQWRKVKQMQPVLLWIISCRQFKETLKNVWTIHLNLIKCFDRDFECSISTFELGSRPSTDSGEGAQGDNILVLHVGARLPSQDKILQTDLAKV